MCIIFIFFFLEKWEQHFEYNWRMEHTKKRAQNATYTRHEKQTQLIIIRAETICISSKCDYDFPIAMHEHHINDGKNTVARLFASATNQ